MALQFSLDQFKMVFTHLKKQTNYSCLWNTVMIFNNDLHQSFERGVTKKTELLCFETKI